MRFIRSTILTAMIVFNITNILISAYMAYASVNAGVKCQCAVRSIYYYMIVVYFFWSVAFVIYSLCYLNNMAKGKLLAILLFCYTVSTIAFIVGVNKYVQTLKSRQCNCIQGSYENMLLIMSHLRLLMVVLTMFLFAIWLLYWLFSTQKR
jgi:hypothetical protein